MLIRLPFPSEIYVSPCLNELDLNWLFDDIAFGLNNDHKLFLIRQIMNRYGNRQIGFAERGTFKARLKWRIESIWTEQYQPLFLSVLLANKDNFLETEKMKHETTRDRSKTYKDYSNQKSGGEASGSKEHYINATNSKSTKSDSNGFDVVGVDAVDKFSRKTKEGNLEKHTSTNDNLNTQTPQTATLTMPLNPLKTGTGAIYGEKLEEAESEGGDVFEDTNMELPIWNEGILTAATRDNESGMRSNSRQTGEDFIDNKHSLTGEVSGESADGWEQGFSQTGGGEKDSQAHKQQAIKTDTGSEAEGEKEYFTERGYRGINISAFLKDYRSTLEPFTRQFCMEIKHYFLRTF